MLDPWLEKHLAIVQSKHCQKPMSGKHSRSEVLWAADTEYLWTYKVNLQLYHWSMQQVQEWHSKPRRRCMSCLNAQESDLWSSSCWDELFKKCRHMRCFTSGCRGWHALVHHFLSHLCLSRDKYPWCEYHLWTTLMMIYSRLCESSWLFFFFFLGWIL